MIKITIDPLQRLKERHKFLWELWMRLRKYKMKTSGNTKIDTSIRKLYGEWL